MSEINKSYRVRTNVGEDSFIPLTLEQEYDVLDILSLKIRNKDTFKLHNANVGIIVGRVQANNGFGIPNAKVSVFIRFNSNNSDILKSLYPFTSPSSKNSDGIRYNLLPDEKTGECHQVVGTFPSKRYLLDNDVILEVFDEYYKYTTQTNNSGDYMLFGIPTGDQTVHVDVDLSDCGILSQRPRDFVYKGYTIEQFENPNMFKNGTDYSTLSQVFTQNKSVYVYPYWGNESLEEQIGLTRLDFDISYKFEPTCVFIGSVISDNASQGISKKCIPTENMGNMDELIAGKGTIEMIRKTVGGDVEEFQIRGTELINGDGVWCYQIPMNLDYMMTDEYGNMVPTDNPEKGIPTRTRVRFRISMEDMEENTDNFFRAKILVPHNPQNKEGIGHEDYDYEFGSYTKDESFRDLFWNNVYTVKSYIPRFQKKKVLGWKTKKFTGIKGCQNFGSNNPLPYNNIRIHLPLMFRVLCILLKAFIRITAVFNFLIAALGNGLVVVANTLMNLMPKAAKSLYEMARKLKLNVIEDGLCPDLENWYFAPMSKNNIKDITVKKRLSDDDNNSFNILQNTLDALLNEDDNEMFPKDNTSIDTQNADVEDESVCITIDTDYLISCMEMNLAQEYKVINFDFYNDWLNGVLYFPRWMRNVRTKRSFNGNTIVKTKIKACMDDTSTFSKARRYTQLCSLGYERSTENSHTTFSRVSVKLNNDSQVQKANKYHKKSGISQVKIFGKNGGICHEHTTLIGQHVYYLKPCEWTRKTTPQNRKVNLFATDLVLLGSLNSCDIYGLPQAFSHLAGTTYIMPPNIALTNLETDSAFFTSSNGRLCSKTNKMTNRAMTIEQIDGETSNPLTAELNAYSGASENYDVNFDGDENDTVALTELAGISWNYIGPGQGTNIPKQLYYPGGHFIGLSCSNSQTNIKSCVNLERICEAGTSMSQRKEEVAAVINDEVKYVYTVPSGLIAGGDIIDDEFRAMFASMNQRRLIATRLNPETGYLTYDFLFVKPNNFNGELKQYASSNAYNKAIAVPDESTTLSNYGIANSSLSPDTDLSESAYTQVKTIEQTSVDYYRFRLGLDYDNLTGSNGKHTRQFAYYKNNKYYLPQYENSYYFYFGLKAGATALDEFNKEFFSECEKQNLIEYDYGITVTVDDYNFEEGASNVNIEIKNMSPEFYYVIRNNDNGNVFITGNTSDVEFNLMIPYGSYTISVKDSDELVATKRFIVGENLQVGVLNTQNFTFPLTGDTFSRNVSNTNVFYGGFVEISEAFIDTNVEFDSKYMVLFDHGTDPYSTQYPICNKMINSSGYAIYYLNRKDVESDVYVRYEYPDNHYVYIFLETITITDNSRIKLHIGDPMLIDFDNIKSASTSTWWDSSTTAHEFGDTHLSGWSIRNSIIKRTGSGETFSNNVTALTGNKIVFGSLQNHNSVYVEPNKQLYSSEFIDNWENGYTLDDSASYYATYGKQYTPNINQYQATTIDGFDVMGKWLARFSGETGTTKNVIVVAGTNQSSALRDNGGCVVKSVLSPAVVGGVFKTNPNRVECFGDEELISEITVGVVYPTVQYPVIVKPFKVNANYFYFSEKAIKLTEDKDGDTLSIERYEVYEFLEGRITNGLSYKGYYSGKSLMTGADAFMETTIEYDENENLVFVPVQNRSKFIAGNNDFEGVSQNATSDVVLYISGATPLVRLIGSRKYSIIEGYPMHELAPLLYVAYSATTGSAYTDSYLYENIAETRELTLEPYFYDYIKYAKDQSSNNIRFIGAGSSDYDVEYYYCDKGNQSLRTAFRTGYLPQERNYIYAVSDKFMHNFKEFYMLIKYTELAPPGMLGVEMAIKVTKTPNHKYYVAHVPIYSVIEDEGESAYTLSFVDCEYQKGSTFESGDMPTMASVIESHTSGIVKCVYNVSITADRVVNGRYDISLDSFTRVLLPQLTDDKKITMNVDSVIPYMNPDNIFVVGIKRYKDGQATGNVCKIYSTLNQIEYINYN